MLSMSAAYGRHVKLTAEILKLDVAQVSNLYTERITNNLFLDNINKKLDYKCQVSKKHILLEQKEIWKDWKRVPSLYQLGQ